MYISLSINGFNTPEGFPPTMCKQLVMDIVTLCRLDECVYYCCYILEKLSNGYD